MSKDGFELEPELRPVVNELFPVYDSNAGHDHLTYYVTLPSDEEKAYDELRKRLKSLGYLPILRRKGGEVHVDIIPAPPKKKSWIIVNILLLLATIGTTILAGTMHWMTYNGISFSSDPVTLTQDFLSSLWGGFVFFSIPLMLILGSHELGHYFVSKWHKVDATLPYFIPSPFTFGTFGAFISVKEPIPSKKALLDIGLAGPVCGLVVAIPVTLLGLLLADMYPATASPADAGSTLTIGVPMLFRMLEYFIPGGSGYIHPTAFAGWVGMFVTAINLLPAGQLDGGHVARALLGDKAKYLSISVIVLLVGLGLFVEWSWILFALIIVFLGISHPPPLNDITDLDSKRVAAGILAGVIFVACFVPNPLGVSETTTTFDLRVAHDNATAYADYGDSNATFRFELVNDGDTDVDIVVNAMALNWTSSFMLKADDGNWTALPAEVSAESGRTVRIVLAANVTGAAPGEHDVWLNARCREIGRTEEALLAVHVRGFAASVNASVNNTVEVRNLLPSSQSITLDSGDAADGWRLGNGTVMKNPVTVLVGPSSDATAELVRSGSEASTAVDIVSIQTGEAQRVTLVWS